MTYPAPVLPDLLVGWQKVADRYNMPIYVFQTRGHIPRGLERGSRRGAPSGHPGPPGDVRTRSRHCLGRSRLQGSVDRIALRANEDPGPHCPRRSPGERFDLEPVYAAAQPSPCWTGRIRTLSRGGESCRRARTGQSGKPLSLLLRRHDAARHSISPSREVGYREGRSDIAQGPGAAIGDRLIVGDAVTSPAWPASTWTESGQYDSSSRSLSIEQMARMPRDHQVLVGRYDPGRHGGAGARDPRATFGISLLVQGDAKPMRLPAGTRPYLGRVLADARSEDERIEPAERCGERSELASDAVDEEVDRLFCRWGIACQQGAHV